MHSITFLDGSWHEGNVPLIGADDHAVWLGSIVFDGARAFEGTTPDLDRHCQRLVDSGAAMELKSMLTAGEIEEIALEGVRRFPQGMALYIRPMLFATAGLQLLRPDPESTKFCLTIFAAPMPAAEGFAACLSSFRRPTEETAITKAKASCHYPNGARALAEATGRGFDNALMLDAMGDVCEFTTANVFLVSDGVCVTPVPNNTFLNGITRQRIIKLLRDDGVEVVERTVEPAELAKADEIFATGNYSKVQPVTRYEERNLQPGPTCRRARELYWDFAHSRR